MRIAAKVAASKAAHPENFCPAPRCLWRTNGERCPRHAITEAAEIREPEEICAPFGCGRPASHCNCP